MIKHIKRIFIIILAILFLMFGGCSAFIGIYLGGKHSASRSTDYAYGSLIGEFTITHYCTEKYPHICNAGPPYKTAMGTDVKPNYTIAVDPKIIPLGSKVIIDGDEYVAEDTGGAIKGYHIDVAVSTHAEAMKLGTQKNVQVYWALDDKIMQDSNGLINSKGMIANCGKDENGTYSGGTAGDQSGQEWVVKNWYNRPWKCILRYNGQNASAVRSLIASYAVDGANNAKIGYDQSQRLTFWNELKKVGYQPKKITNPCEADCSSSTVAVIKSVGFSLGIKKLQDLDANLTTYNMRSELKKVGFKVLTGAKYTNSPDNLDTGDILLNDDCHVAIYVSSREK